MQRVITSVAWFGMSACLQQPTFVAITPDHGYVDGCTAVVLSGHHLGTDATAAIGGAEMPLAPAEEDPSLPEWAQDVGFEYTGVSPPGDEGFADVVLTVDGERLVLPEGFFYQACPATFQVNEVSEEGGEVSLAGCGLSDEVTVRVMQYTEARAATDACGAAATEVATAALTSVCGTAAASATLPDLADGTYALWFEHSDGTLDDGSSIDPYYGEPVCEPFTFTVGGGT